MTECIFCKIAAGEIPSSKIYEDQQMLAFKDINPAAPVHVLFIPKKHLANLGEMTAADEGLLGHMMAVVGKVALELGLTEGYRVVSNCGEKAGQSVNHLHFHLLGGRNLQWPPG
ncbi:MAG: histidine triad nucleotide-binding protein [Peptococcaceae bacterium]|nr:histidine triad nucleotide-binding protein [Peptococcaceae bacterium]